MTTYNGWTNYETWNVKLWLDNDEGTYDEVRDMARRSRSAYDLEQQLREFVLDGMPDLGASMYADLLGAALSEVNWQEIAEAYREDEEDDEDDNGTNGQDRDSYTDTQDRDSYTVEG